MYQRRINLLRPFIAYHQAAKGLQPTVAAFNDPSALVPSQLSSVLMRRHSVVLSLRGDRLDPALHKQRPHQGLSGITFGAAIAPTVEAYTHFSYRMLTVSHLLTGTLIGCEKHRRVKVRQDRGQSHLGLMAPILTATESGLDQENENGALRERNQ
jgi:hypothetical protein